MTRIHVDASLLSAIVDSIKAPLLLFDRDMGVVLASRSFFETFRMAPEATIGRRLLELGPGEWMPLRDRLTAVFEGQPMDDVEIECAFEHLGPRIMRLSARVLPPHRLFGVLSVEDVTDRVLASRERERLLADLTRVNTALDAFASTAAHDLKAPLRRIRLQSERLLARMVSASDEDVVATLEKTVRATSGMQHLIDRLLTYARVASAITAVPSAVAVSDVLAQVLYELREELEASGAVVHRDDVLPVVSASFDDLHQLFANLIANALKFRLPDTAPALRISSASTDGGGMWDIVVEDGGIGFPPEDAERIFAPFSRLQGGTQYDGTGLGLAICRSIAERHGGRMRAESFGQSGAKFIVSLPAAAARA